MVKLAIKNYLQYVDVLEVFAKCILKFKYEFRREYKNRSHLTKKIKKNNRYVHFKYTLNGKIKIFVFM